MKTTRETNPSMFRAKLMDILNFTLQVVVLVVLIFTLRSYLKANELSREANELSRKTFMSSQCVWITFDGSPVIGIFQGNCCPITITVKNVSLSPALHFQVSVQFKDISNQWSQPVDMWGPTDTEKTLLPQSPYWINGNITATNDSNAAATAIANAQYLFKFTLRYSDSYGRKVEITQTYLTKGPQNNQQWAINESTAKYDEVTQP